ncbi:MAG: metallophosphoesterase family protein [Candidatus Binataceae bacterium]|nr:metallophosphoesterase family protein [Candidatus Binataceae bacterium]
MFRDGAEIDMKIVSFGDVHMATRNLDRMTGVMRDTDLVIVSGDLTNFGGNEDARKVIDDVRRACPHVLALPGNLDRREVIPFLDQQGVALHGKGVVINGVGIFGCGGSNITPFGTPTELTEDEIYQTLRSGYEQVKEHSPLLMICHTPPYDTKCDRILSGRPVGSIGARRFIEEVGPAVCISGHVHESAGVDRIGSTTVLNAGPFKDGGYIVVTDSGDGLDARLEFL